MSVILSIKPEYCKEIQNRNKMFEFRRKIFKKDVKYVYMYSTAPVQKIVGKFTISKITEDNPKKLWDNFKFYSGLNEKEFFSYFDGVERGFAIGIKEVYSCNPFNPNEIIPDFHPPQSFIYCPEDINK